MTNVSIEMLAERILLIQIGHLKFHRDSTYVAVRNSRVREFLSEMLAITK